MHLKQKLTFMVLGSILTLAGYLLATPTRDVTAQSETDKSEPLIVDEIVCRKLRVVDENDKTRVEIGANFLTGYMDFKNSDGVKAISIGAVYGLKSMTFWNDDKDGLYIGAVRDSGFMHVRNSSGEKAVSIRSDENGGRMSIYGNTDDDEPRVELGIGEYGGQMFILGNGNTDGKPPLRFGFTSDENGGLMVIYGTDSKARVVSGITEKGNGAISTWYENDYKFFPLKLDRKK